MAIAQEIASGNYLSEFGEVLLHDAMRILREGTKVASKDESISEGPSTGYETSSLQWKTSRCCPEMSLQVCGRSSHNALKPICSIVLLRVFNGSTFDGTVLGNWMLLLPQSS